MSTLAACLVTLATCLPSATESKKADAAKKPEPIRVLVVTGVDWGGHRWKETGPAFRKVLEQDKRFDVRLVEDPDFLASPAVQNYDVICIHFKNYKPVAQPQKVHENLVNAVKSGKGLVLLHFACGAFEDWPEFADLAGRVWDRKISPPHDPHGPYTVEITDKNHPITRGMKDFDAYDELYICLKGDRPIDVLATARSKVTGKDYPMAFAFQYGKGRVFHTPLGHDVRAIEMPGVADLLRRATLWTAGKQP